MGRYPHWRRLRLVDMGNIQFRNNKILFVDNKIAFGPACCCPVPVLCGACSTGVGPAEFLLNLPAGGFAGTNCDEYSGDFILSLFTDGVTHCVWKYKPPSPPFPDIEEMRIRLYDTRVLDVFLFTFSHVIAFETTLPDDATVPGNELADCFIPNRPITVPFLEQYGVPVDCFWDADFDVTVDLP